MDAGAFVMGVVQEETTPRRRVDAGIVQPRESALLSRCRRGRPGAPRVWSNLEPELHAELDLVGIGKRSGERLAGEAREPRILESQTQRAGDVVADADAVVDTVAQRPRIPGRQCGHRVGGQSVALRVAQAPVERKTPEE